MKIAVVTDDGQTISRHFGRAKFYAVYTVENGEITHREQVDKPAHGRHARSNAKQQPNVNLHEGGDHAHGTGHGTGHNHNHDHADMVNPVRDCDIVLARGMGYGAHNGLSAAGIRPIITDIASIEDAVMACANNTIVDHPEKLH